MTGPIDHLLEMAVEVDVKAGNIDSALRRMDGWIAQGKRLPFLHYRRAEILGGAERRVEARQALADAWLFALAVALLTPMPAFAELSDEDAWAVAFHVLSLRYRTKARPARPLDLLAAEIWLKAAATLPDDELVRALPGSATEQQRLLATLRRHSGAGH